VAVANSFSEDNFVDATRFLSSFRTLIDFICKTPWLLGSTRYGRFVTSHSVPADSVTGFNLACQARRSANPPFGLTVTALTSVSKSQPDVARALSVGQSRSGS
jgi:hypothetical protein